MSSPPAACISPAMQCVATLIADPVRADLSSHHVAAVSGALAAAGAEITATDWLDEGIACDLVFTGPTPAAARQAVSDAIAAPTFDIAVQPRQGRRKDLLVIDMDSTLVGGETLDALADHAGEKDAVAATIQPITEKYDVALHVCVFLANDPEV